MGVMPEYYSGALFVNRLVQRHFSVPKQLHKCRFSNLRSDLNLTANVFQD